MTSRSLKHWMMSIALVASFPVSAQLDATFRAAAVHAGPDPAFPQVTQLPAAANVHVVGCVSNRQWCDIQSGRTRGWIRAADLRQSDRVRRAPEVTFSVDEYWGAHYRSRPWFSRRADWIGWGAPGFQPPKAAAR
jgi:uncharacterized protein YraI